MKRLCAILSCFCALILLVVFLSSCVGGTDYDWTNSDVSQLGSGEIIGTVYDAETGTLISGVSVNVPTLAKTSFTSSTGNFTLENLPIGTYNLSLSKTGYANQSFQEVTVVASKETSLEIPLYKEGGVISGTITNSRNAIMQNATVELVNEETSSTITTTTTNTIGKFEIKHITNGTYTIRVTPVDETFCTNEKNHIAVESGTASMLIAISGQPPTDATYVGSDECQRCHPTQSDTYHATSHANVLKTVGHMVDAADKAFQDTTTLTLDIDGSAAETLVSITVSINSDGSPQMTLGSSDTYVVQNIYGGNSWKESYLTEIDGSTYVLPLSWSLATESFFLDDEESAHWFASDGTVKTPSTDQSYEQRCVGCHASGFSVRLADGKVQTVSTADSSEKYLESKIGCERCHGPGSKHAETARASAQVDSLSIIQPHFLSLKGNTQVCGQCHASGTAKQFAAATLSYPVDAEGNLYRPGKDLDDYFTPNNDNWETPSLSKGYHEEYSDYLQSTHYQNTTYSLRCTDCHNTHLNTDAIPHLLKQSVEDNSLCLSCHEALHFPTEYAIMIHTQHPYEPEASGSSRCVGCHFSKTGTLAQMGDVGGHSFNPIQPETTLTMLQNLIQSGATNIQETDLIPSPCVQCHNTLQVSAEENGEAINVLAGDPTDEAYLEMLSQAYEEKFEVAKPNNEYASFSHGAFEGWLDQDSDDHHGKYYLEHPETCRSTCHGENLEGGILSNGRAVTSCFACHYSYDHEIRVELDFGEGASWIYKHSNYFQDIECQTCHGENYDGGISGVRCDTCHADPGNDFSVFNDTNCLNGACHATPPASGAHKAHYGTSYLDDSADPQYGDTANYSSEDSYAFGCGTCHPMDSSKHRNGTVDVELYDASADPSTIKFLNAFSASYDSETGQCTNVYCHSYTEYTGLAQGPVKVPFPAQIDELGTSGDTIEEQVEALNSRRYPLVSSYFVWNNFKAPDDQKEEYYGLLPKLKLLDDECSSMFASQNVVCQGGEDENGLTAYAYDDSFFGYPLDYPDYEVHEVRRFQTTPNWYGNEMLSCDGCHGFPPRTYAYDGSTLKSEAAIDKHSFVITEADGSLREVGHMANMNPYSLAPLRCQVCHDDTVQKISLSLWEAGKGWSRENGLVKLDALEITSKAKHANGAIDVVLDTSNVASTYKFKDEDYPYTLKAYPETSGGMAPLYMYNLKTYYYGIKGHDAPGASWNANTKSCSNVSCHLEQTHVKWTSPYRDQSGPECYQCHQRYSNTRRNQNATLCWPHSSYDGCDDRDFIFHNSFMEEMVDAPFFGP